MDEIKRDLLDKCFRLGLPVSSNDSIATLQMYLEADSKLEADNFDFKIENQVRQKKRFKSLLLKLVFSLVGRI